MSIFNHKQLIIARESRGKTQQQLVASVDGLNQGNYSKMEKGLLNVSDETLSKIATSLDYPVSFFFKTGVRTPISSFYYRKRVSLPKKSLSILEAQLDILRISVDELLDSVDIPEYTLPSFEISANLTPSDAARKLRDYLKLPKGPIKNLIRLLESVGVIVYFIKTDIEKFDGITLITDKGQPIIFINNSLPNDRKRFTIAHELMHLILHIPFNQIQPDRDIESEANEGAAEFLMPYLDCRNDLQDLRYAHLAVLKSYWGVSKAMVLYRAKEIKAITKERATNLYIELARYGERKKETGYVDLEKPAIVDLIIGTYENQLGYTLDDLLNLISINKSDYFLYFDNSKYMVAVKIKKVIEFNPNKNTA